MIREGDVLSAIAERTVSNAKDISQRKKQRRTGFVDLYGVESFRSVSDSANYYISVSPDLEYFERYGFKIAVDNAASIGSITIEIDGVDLTAYFREQQGSWISGNGIYPSSALEESDDGRPAYYDVLDACGLLNASGDSESVDKILSPGVHTLTISGLSADVSLILYMKYSHINR